MFNNGFTRFLKLWQLALVSGGEQPPAHTAWLPLHSHLCSSPTGLLAPFITPSTLPPQAFSTCCLKYFSRWPHTGSLSQPLPRKRHPSLATPALQALSSPLRCLAFLLSVAHYLTLCTLHLCSMWLLHPPVGIKSRRKVVVSFLTVVFLLLEQCLACSGI